MNKKFMPVFACFLLLAGVFPVSVFAQTAPQTHIYVIGTYMDGTTNYNCYWVDGERKELPIRSRNPDETILSVSISAITATDGVVYIAGNYVSRIKFPDGSTQPQQRACYWRDGILQLLSSPEINYNSSVNYHYVVNDISVINGKVYVVGFRRLMNSYEDSTSIYWIDGEIKSLVGSEIKSIVIDDDSPYFILDDGSLYAYGQNIKVTGNAIDISVINGDVFLSGMFYKQISGFSYSRPCYWLNGKRNDLPIQQTHNNEKVHYTTSGIVVKDGKTYIAGGYSGPGDIKKGCYWIDNELKELKEDGATVTGIVVSDGKVYLSGTYREAGGFVRACYWVDGERKNLSAGTSAKGIVVVTE